MNPIIINETDRIVPIKMGSVTIAIYQRHNGEEWVKVAQKSFDSGKKVNIREEMLKEVER